MHFFNEFEINIKFSIFYAHIECFLCAYTSPFANFEIKLAQNDPIKGKTTFINVSYNSGDSTEEVRAFPRWPRGGDSPEGGERGESLIQVAGAEGLT